MHLAISHSYGLPPALRASLRWRGFLLNDRPTSMRLTVTRRSCVIATSMWPARLEFATDAASHAEPRRIARAVFGETYIACCPMIFRVMLCCVWDILIHCHLCRAPIAT